MSDTTTTESPITTTPAAKTKAPRDYDHAIEFVDEVPPHLHGGGGTRGSALDNLLDELIAKIDAGEHGGREWARIGRYRNASAATAAANVLRQRHGRDETAKGFTFKTGRLDDNAMGVFVRFRRDAILPGALDSHVSAEKLRLEGLAAKKNGKGEKAAPAAASTPAAPAPVPAPKATPSATKA